MAGDEHPVSVAVLKSLLNDFRRSRDDLRAVAICSDVRLPDSDSDAVRVQLEHQDGQAIAVLLPYKKRRSAQGIEYQDFRAARSHAQVWRN
jgi:hypothetical protein